jgi:hypothetical protein
MDRLFWTAARRLALVVSTWASLTLSLRAQEDQNHEQPGPFEGAPSVYLRVPRGAAANEATAKAPEPGLAPVSSMPAVRAPDARANSPLFAAPELPGPASIKGELWLVSTRRLPKAGDNAIAPEFAPDVYRYLGQGNWVPSSLVDFLQSAPAGAVTTIFVHGNDTDAAYAAGGGGNLYVQLLAGVAADAPPMRFVIWSWPNEPTTIRVRRIAQANASRTNIEGYFLAAFLRGLPPETPTSIAGYSSGAGVVTGGLHVLGGGALEGRTLPWPTQPAPRSIDAVLLGAATANDWLLPGKPHERALSQVKRMVVTVNATDGVLQWYTHLWGRGGAAALGATGVADAARLGSEQAKLVQVDLQNALHRHHFWRYYSGSPQVIALLRNEMLLFPAQFRRDNDMAQRPR